MTSTRAKVMGFGSKTSWVRLAMVLAPLVMTATMGCAGADEEATADGALFGGTIEGGAGAVDVVTVDSDGNEWGCTGVVISPKVLITAAHCFDPVLGNAKEGTVNVKVSYSRGGTDWSCISHQESPGRCAQAVTTRVRRLKGESDSYVGKDFAVLWSSPNVGGASWRGITDFRSIDISPISSARTLELWGSGIVTNAGTDDHTMRHAPFKTSGTNKNGEVVFAKDKGNGRVCFGDSGGPLYSSTYDWVNAIQSMGDIDDGDSCIDKGESLLAYVMTKSSIDVINQELAKIDPSGPGCAGVGMRNKYRCFIPR